MNALRIRSIAAVVVACAVALPATAFAGEPGTSVSAGAKVAAKAGEKESQGKAKGKAKAKFPLKAERFRSHVTKRVAKAREHLAKKLDHKALSKEAQASVKKDFELGVVKINAAVDAAAKDGVVTKDEAEKVRAVSKQLRQQIKAELEGKKAEKGGKGKSQGQAKANPNAKVSASVEAGLGGGDA